MDSLAKIVDWIKLPPRFLFAIATITSLLLFVFPDSFLRTLGLLPYLNQWRWVVAVVFLVSLGLFVVHYVAWAADKAGSRFQAHLELRQNREKLHELTEEEKKILREYIDNQTKTQGLSTHSGVVDELESNGIIRQAGPEGPYYHSAYNIEPWAWDYLNKHPELVGLSRTRAHNSP